MLLGCVAGFPSRGISGFPFSGGLRPLSPAPAPSGVPATSLRLRRSPHACSHPLAPLPPGPWFLHLSRLLGSQALTQAVGCVPSPGKSNGETEVWEGITQGPVQILTLITQPAVGILPTRSLWGTSPPCGQLWGSGHVEEARSAPCNHGPGPFSRTLCPGQHECPSPEAWLQISALKGLFSLGFPKLDGGGWVR